MSSTYSTRTGILFSILGLILLAKVVAAQQIIPSNSNPSEPLVAINPQNPEEMVITANSNLFFISKNGGKSWTQRALIRNPDPKDAGDPVPQFDARGKLYVSCLSGSYRCTLLTFDGQGFEETRHAAPRNGLVYEDKPWLILDHVGEKTRAVILYTTFGVGVDGELDTSRIFCRESLEPFDDWSESLLISGSAFDAGEGKQQNGAAGIRDKAGNIHVVWLTSDGIESAVVEADLSKVTDRRQIAPVTNGIFLKLPSISSTRKYPSIAFDSARNEVLACWADQSSSGELQTFLSHRSADGGDWTTAQIPGLKSFLPSISVDAGSRIYLLAHVQESPSVAGVHSALLLSSDRGLSFNTLNRTSSWKPKSTFVGDYFGIALTSNKLFTSWPQAPALGGDNELYFYSQPLPKLGVTEVANLEASIISVAPLRIRVPSASTSSVLVSISDALGRIYYTGLLPLNGDFLDIPFDEHIGGLQQYFVKISEGAHSNTLKILHKD